MVDDAIQPCRPARPGRKNIVPESFGEDPPPTMRHLADEPPRDHAEAYFHTLQLLKGVGLATLIGVGTQLSIGNNENDLVNALRQSVQQSTNQAEQRVVERELDVQPTITVRPGWPLRVIVSKDLVDRDRMLGIVECLAIDAPRRANAEAARGGKIEYFSYRQGLV